MRRVKNVTLRQLRVFSAVARHLSLVRAAEEASPTALMKQGDVEPAIMNRPPIEWAMRASVPRRTWPSTSQW